MALNPKRFGTASGILFGLTLFGSVWYTILTGLGNQFLNIYQDMHPWYIFVPIASPVGSVVAIVDGFVQGFIFLYILIWLYNWLEEKKI